MMSETTDLINAMVSGNAIDTETAFSAAMAEKLSGKLDTLRQTVAQNMFKTPDEEIEAEAEEIESTAEQETEEPADEEQTEQ